MIDSVTTINLFGNTNMITNIQKSGYSHEFSYQCRVKNRGLSRRNYWSRTKTIPSRDDIKCSESE